MNRRLSWFCAALLTANLSAMAEDTAARHCRAGHPRELSPLARWTYDGHYVGYYTGGGARRFHPQGECRYQHEGVWGMDYNIVFPRLRHGVVLNWWHGRRHQDGGGTYEPDHPNNPFKSFLIDHANRSRAHDQQD